MPTLSGFSAFSFVLFGKIIYFFVNMQVFSKKTKFSSFFLYIHKFYSTFVRILELVKSINEST